MTKENEEKKEVIEEKKEVKEEVKQSSDVKISESEQRAKALGWLPKEEFSGDPEDWVSAKEFLRVGELIGSINSQKRKTQELEDVVKSLAKHNEKVFEAGYKKAIEEIKVAKREALKEGDVEAVEKLDEELDKTKEEFEKERKDREDTLKKADQSVQLHPAFVTWLGVNSWYGKDNKKTAYADAVAKDLREATPNITFEELLKEISLEIQDKFGKKRELSSPVEGAGHRSSGTKKSGGLSEADLSEDEKRIMNTFIKTIPGFTKEKYLKDLEAVNKGGR